MDGRKTNGGGSASHQQLTRDFLAALHPFLVSCSRQEFLSYFADFEPKHQDFIYKAFALTVTQARKNAVAEFQCICEESQFFETLDRRSGEEFALATEFRHSLSPIEVVREISVKRKLEEVNNLKQTLQQVSGDNRKIARQLEKIRAKFAEAIDVKSVNAVLGKLSSVDIQLESDL